MGLSPGSETGMAREVFSIILVFLLLAGTLRWARRRGRLSGSSPFSPNKFWARLHQLSPQRSRGLEPVDRLILTPHHVLHIIRVQGTEIILATHPHGCTPLSDVTFSAKRAEGASA